MISGRAVADRCGVGGASLFSDLEVRDFELFCGLAPFVLEERVFTVGASIANTVRILRGVGEPPICRNCLPQVGFSWNALPRIHFMPVG